VKSRASARPHGEYLVDRKLLARQRRRGVPRLRREEPRICPQVELCLIIAGTDDQACEAAADLYMRDGTTRRAEGRVNDRKETIDGIDVQTEEVEIARLPVNLAAHDQGGAAGKREPGSLVQLRDDPRYS
jgi:hypothetical protein